MQTKILEIRDSGTMIAALCVNMNKPDNDTQRWYLRRYGYPCDGNPNVVICHASMPDGGTITNDPYAWRGARTWGVAHNYIIEHWNELKDGDVVCVETILGERETPKISERLATV